MSRPKANIDPEQVKQLAMIQCSYAEMAAVVGCNESTLTRRFAQVIKEGREVGKSSLKRAQYKAAMNGNPTMLIWLGKQHLEQKDQPMFNQSINHTTHVTVEIQNENKTPQESGNRISEYLEV